MRGLRRRLSMRRAEESLFADADIADTPHIHEFFISAPLRLHFFILRFLCFFLFILSIHFHYESPPSLAARIYAHKAYDRNMSFDFDSDA